MPDCPAARLVVIDTEPDASERFRALFDALGYDVRFAGSGEEGLAMCRARLPDAVLTDLRLPGMDGLEVIDAIRRDFPDVPVVVVSGANGLGEAIRRGAWDHVDKPVSDLDVLRHAIEKALERARLLRANRDHEERLEREIRERAMRLRDSEQRYRAVVEQAPDAIILMTPEGQIVDVNQRACDALGYPPEELVRLVMSDLDDDRDLERAIASFGEGRPEPMMREGRHRRRDGTSYSVECRLSPLDLGGRRFVMALCRDITDRKATEDEKTILQEQLRQAQKMEAVGQLAGGLAHDFNNVLTTIVGNVDLLMDAAGTDGSDSPDRDRLEQIQNAALAAASLTRRLLAFSRREMSEPEVLDLDRILTELHAMLRRLIPEDIALDVVHPAETLCVRADVGQIEQILMNLVVNARDAMPEGGRLTLEAAPVTLDSGYVALHPEAGSGPHARLSVSDTGHGMPEEVADHAFEPFFTTKPAGQGTGLGLAMVYGLVRRAGGHVILYSEPGLGTTIQVYLPVVHEKPEDRAEPHEEPPAPSGTETILVCEDDDTVRHLAEHMLSEAGYTVLTGPDGRGALAEAEGADGPVHVLLTDVILPDLNGRQVAKGLVEIHPDARVLFMSGYATSVIAHHGVLDDEAHLLRKPFSRRALLARVREVLDA